MRRPVVLAVTLAVAVSPTLGATAARAGVPVSPHGNVQVVAWDGTTARVCADGQVDDGLYVFGEWVLTIGGYAWNGSVTVPLVTFPVPRVHEGPTFYDCIDVPTTGTFPSGQFQMHLAYAGAGTMDVTGVAGLVLEWDPSDSYPVETSYGTSR